jgi:riboflavin synthase
VAIIPHTWEKTNLSALHPGDGVNVEGDVMGKYVKRILAPHRPGPEG